jgi:hypothetical protein
MSSSVYDIYFDSKIFCEYLDIVKRDIWIIFSVTHIKIWAVFVNRFPVELTTRNSLIEQIKLWELYQFEKPRCKIAGLYRSRYPLKNTQNKCWTSTMSYKNRFGIDVTNIRLKCFRPTLQGLSVRSWELWEGNSIPLLF